MIINTDNNGVFETSLTMTLIREGSEEDVMEQIGTALDEAQGFVFSGEGARAFVVIEVTKE